MATPQNMEKLYSMSEYSLVFCGAPLCRKLPLASTTASEFHHLGWKDCWIMATYVVVSPFAGAELRLPSTESLDETNCFASGLTVSIFLPILTKGRPVADISTSLPGGPTAFEASEDLESLSVTGLYPLGEPSACRILALGSPAPNGFTPLNVAWARPSQKLR